MRQFFIDLFSLDRPFPGHGVRVSPPGVYDQAVLQSGSIEARAHPGGRWHTHGVTREITLTFAPIARHRVGDL